MAQGCDFLIVGAGIAGASLGYELARRGGSVVVLERESAAGYHTTGRSAAAFAASYGSLLARRLTGASRTFFDSPPDGFCGHALLAPRGVLFVASPDQEDALARLSEQMVAAGNAGETVDAAGAARLVPVLRRDQLRGAIFDRASMDIDVHGLHHGYLAGLRRAGGRLALNAEVRAIARAGGRWQVRTRDGAFEAPVLVNAAGAWGDEVAALAGAAPAGLVPMRRTAFTFDPPPGIDPGPWPMVVDASESLYFKPDAGRILASPADETASPPCDAQAEEIDIAVAMERLQALTTLAPRTIAHKWAGLRTFAPDRLPVAGFDDGCEGFFWLVGQGGTGIQMAPALARLGAALACGEELPVDLAALGVDERELSAGRAALCRAAPAGR